MERANPPAPTEPIAALKPLWQPCSQPGNERLAKSAGECSFEHMSEGPPKHRSWTIEKRPGRWTLSDDDQPEAKKRALHWGEAGTSPGTLGLYSVISHCINHSEGLPGTIFIRYSLALDPLILHYEPARGHSMEGTGFH